MKGITNKLDRVLFPFVGFKWIWVAVLVFCVPSLLIHIFLWPSSTVFLSLSANNPWGVLTSPFVHVDLTHFFNNLVLFLTLTFFFVVTNLSRGLEGRRYLSKVFFGTIFIAGTFVSGPVEVIYRSFIGEAVKVMGSSGIVYAALGVLLTSCLVNLLFRHVRRVRKFLSDEVSVTMPGERFLFYIDFVFNLAIVWVVIVWVFSPDFLGVGSHIGRVAHASGFLVALLASFFSFSNFFGLKGQSGE